MATGVTVTADGVVLFDTNQAYIWTGLQTFTGGVTVTTTAFLISSALLHVKGSGTGYTAIASANAGATNYTITLPTITGTLTIAGATTVMFNPSNPTGTNSTAAYVMMGIGSTVAFTPSKYGNIRLTLDGLIYNGTSGDGLSWVIQYGTGTAPINGAAATGTGIGVLHTISNLAGLAMPFSNSVIITGLTPSIAYWFDFAVEAVTGGTAVINSIVATIQELPY